MAGAASVLDVDGVEARVTSADKVFFSKRGETKLDLADAPWPPDYLKQPNEPPEPRRTPRLVVASVSQVADRPSAYPSTATRRSQTNHGPSVVRGAIVTPSGRV